MASSCHIGVLTETNIECWHTKATLHACGVNKSRKSITFSQLKSADFNVNFKDDFMREKVNPIICIICVFSSSLRLGALSNCFLIASFT